MPSSNPSMVRPKIPVIIDTDPGVDDVIAILFALASPEIEILAFIVTFGNTDIDSCYQNILKVYLAVSRHLDAYPEQRPRFPNFFQTVKPILARGAAGPLAGETHSAQYFHGRDGLSNIAQRHPDLTPESFPEDHLTPSDLPGPQVALDLLKAHDPRSITWIVLGPLTTFAQLLRLDSSTVCQRVGRVVCMGGALDAPGNTSPVAEFNFYADPFAVKEILATKEILQRFSLLPLDITTPHELPFPAYVEHVDPLLGSVANPSESSEKSPLVHFTSSFLERTREVMLKSGKNGMELHDIVVVWYATQPVADGWSGIMRHFGIERIGELTRGMLVVDRRDWEKITADKIGTNRAELEAAKRRAQSPMPALVETEGEPKTSPCQEGVHCIVKSPGPEALLTLLLRRVWGVQPLNPSAGLTTFI